MSQSTAALPPAPRRRLARRRVVYPVLFLGLGLALLLNPASFRQIVRAGLEFAAQRRSGTLTIGRVSGNLFTPIELHDLRFRHVASGGARTDVQIDHATVSFDAPGLWQKNRPFFRSLDLDGGSIAVQFEAPKDEGDEKLDRHESALSWLPGKFSTRRLDLAIQAGETSATIDDLHLEAIDGGLGPLDAASVTVSGPHFEKRLREVTGQTDYRDHWLSLISVRLDDAVQVENLSTDLKNLLRGRLDTFFEISAFHGSIRGQLETRFDRRQLRIDASGFFYKLEVAGLARFAGTATEAGGEITEGKFSFRGDPFHPENSTGSGRLQAVDFQWDRRRWDSLSVAATLMNRRLEVSEFKLEQAQNSLHIEGKIELGRKPARWLESDFDMFVNAKIGDLGELTQLLGEAAGQWTGDLTAEGSVRRRGRDFNGQMLVKGERMRYGNTPIDELHAALRLEGNDLELTNFDLVRGDDFVRGRGGFKLLGDRYYWGEAKFSIADLAQYADFPAPPRMPWPVGGSARGQWSGDGSSLAHSGAVEVKMGGMVVPKLGQTLPLDLDLAATYSPENIFVTKGRIGQGDVSLTSQINATPQRTELRQFSVRDGESVTASGTLALPIGFDHWADFPQALRDGTIGAEVKFEKFRLSNIERLLGRASTVRGELSGNVKAAGPLNDFQADGMLALRDGTFGESVVGTKIEHAAIRAELAGAELRLREFSFGALGGEVSGGGELNYRNLADPTLRLGLRGRRMQLARGEIEATGEFDITLNGLLSQAYADGEVELTRLNLANPRETLALLSKSGSETVGSHPLFVGLQPALERSPMAGWRFDLTVASASSLPVGPGAKMTADLRAQGRARDLQLGGRIDFDLRGDKEEDMRGSLYLLDEPTLAARATEEKNQWLIIGPSNQPDRVRAGLDFLGHPSVWPEQQASVSGPALDSNFEMTLAPTKNFTDWPDEQ